ncbi:SAP domain-containing ribonucleoprotein isoform X4 [Ascaphus truei]|uniref:SAP domain-containing ribonucleoprotein isoform X4 n=1 Tax=Ascaphus truei TaxID=8439 RepID=UPI003F5A356B
MSRLLLPNQRKQQQVENCGFLFRRRPVNHCSAFQHCASCYRAEVLQQSSLFCLTPEVDRCRDAEKKLVKITSGTVQPDRLQKRAERFNVPASLDSKKAARAARFGGEATTQKGEDTGIVVDSHLENTSPSLDVNSTVNLDKLKERAQRFGLSVSPVSKKSEDDEKLKKRKERFGIVTSSAAITDDVEAKKRKRSERFGIA